MLQIVSCGDLLNEGSILKKCFLVYISRDFSPEKSQDYFVARNNSWLWFIILFQVTVPNQKRSYYKTFSALLMLNTFCNENKATKQYWQCCPNTKRDTWKIYRRQKVRCRLIELQSPHCKMASPENIFFKSEVLLWLTSSQKIRWHKVLDSVNSVNNCMEGDLQARHRLHGGVICQPGTRNLEAWSWLLLYCSPRLTPCLLLSHRLCHWTMTWII